MTLQAGARLGPYEILSPIGAGGMGEIYRAKDTKLGRDVAIKVLPEEVAQDAERLSRFEREARSLAALNHPGIVTIFSVEQSGQTRFLTMELVEGESLDKLLAPGSLSLARFFEIAVPLADALSAAHERGIVHRDLKPANVMVTPEGRVKVLDFGLAKRDAPGPDPSSTDLPTASRLELTGEGRIFGTVAYMSPEQARGEKVDVRSDVFSLGVVLYQMLAGERPFQGESAVDVITAILRDRPPSITDVRADLPPHLGRILRRCLEKNPRDRYQTSRDLFNELRDLRTETSAPPPARRAPASTPVSADSGNVRAEEGFWIAVLPFRHGGGAELAALADGMSEEVVTGLSRFSYLRVISRSSARRYSGGTADVRAVGRELGARYVMEGSLRQAGSVLRVSVQLVDTVSGANLWAETYNRSYQPEAIFDLQDDVVRRIVSTVADTYGVLPHSMSETLRGRHPDELTPYEAVIRGLAQLIRVSADEHASVRAALERAVQEAPGNADCWALLSNMCREEYAHGFNPKPDPLGRALAAARRAVEIAPSNHLAHHALATALFLRREFSAFRNAAERAIALNPMDGFTMAYLGSLIAYSGDWERGCAMAKQAREMNPNHPSWYWFSDCFNAYRQGDDRASLDIARKIQMPEFWRANLALAATYGQLGERESADRALQQLLTLRPDFAAEARTELLKWWAPELVERLMEGLRKAGLEVAGESAAPASSPIAASAAPAPPAEEGFWVAVLPFQHGGGGEPLAALAEGMTEEILTGLSRFSYLRVISRSSTRRYSGESADVRAVGRELGARYVLDGSLRQAGSALRVSVQLIDAVSGAHLWAETYNRPFLAEKIFEIQDDLVPRIVSTVADSHGILPRSMSEALRTKDPELLTPYEAMLRGFSHHRSLNAAEHARIRAALERAVEQAPGNADCWAMLSLIYREEYAHGFNPRPDPIGRALEAARRAVEIAPTNHLAHHALALPLFFRRELQAFRSAAERAIALNPMDGFTIAYVGFLIAYAGDWERGCALAARARSLNPNHPGWYWFPDFFDAYRKKEYRTALDFALKIQMPGFWRSNFALAVAYGQLGERDSASRALQDLLALRPNFGSEARRELAKWWDPELVELLIDGLRKAGLPDGREEAVP